MGIPKFFRFISERYPLINTAFPSEPPLIDNLYLDMNGIIHNCVRASPGNGSSSPKRYAEVATSTRSESDIFLDVFKYIDNLVGLMTPRRVLFLAVDGVAPRAKMNQQRARRFRSAKDRVEDHAQKQRDDPMYAAAGVVPFDSNCITPGTSFMYKLTHALRYFISHKISEDTAWASLEVILSGPEAPGEGEHKIMEYLRTLRESGCIPANTRHCVYGLDADLIMLALVTHEPHFFLLREKVDFNAFWKKKNGPRTATALDLVTFGEFELMSIGVLREYIALELAGDGNNLLPFFDFERLYDDFVFILMLIGNDFLPNIPTLDIADGTLSIMLHLYKRILPLLGGYLTNAGTISAPRFSFFMAKLAVVEEEVLRYRNEQSASGTRRRKGGRALTFARSDLDIIFDLHPHNHDSPPPQPLTEDEMARETQSYWRITCCNPSLQSLKDEFYREKFGQDFVSSNADEVETLVENYIEGISWTLKYYTEGCRRWHWYFPYHYAPLASDFARIDLSRVLQECEHNIVPDKPFRPWEQLLSVLPPLSAWCLPKPFRSLMTSPSSPIYEYYPNDFLTDINGKKNDWEAVVLLPFVDEDRLFEAMQSISDDELSPIERSCNELGPPLVFRFSTSYSRLVQSPFPQRLPQFVSRAKPSSLQLPSIPIGQPFSPCTLEGTAPAGLSEGLSDLPALMIYHFETQLQRVGVNVFGTQSKAESLVLCMHFETDERLHASPDSGLNETSDSSIPFAGDLAERGVAISAPVWYGFPWRRAGSVQSITTEMVTVAVEKGQFVSRRTSVTDFERISGSVTGTLLQKCAIDVEKPRVIVGIIPENNVDRGEEEVLYQLHEMVTGRALPSISNSSSPKPLSKEQTVLYVGHGAYFGHKCVVISTAGAGSIIKVRFDRAVGAAREPPFGYRVVSAANTRRWMSLTKLASETGISVSVADMFLGSLRVRLRSGKDEADLGIGVKYIARALYIPGYARRDDRHHYSFSDKCVDLLRNYKQSFPQLFEGVERLRGEEGRCRGTSIYAVEDLLDGCVRPDEALRAVTRWLGLQEVAELPLVHARSDVLPRETVVQLERHSVVIAVLRDEYEATLSGGDAARMTKDVARGALVTGSEGLDWGRGSSTDHGALPLHFEPVSPSATGLRLGDRVVNRLASGGVPFALRGSVVGIHPDIGASTGSNTDLQSLQQDSSTIIEVVFDTGFVGGGTLGGRCSANRGKAVPAQSLFIIRPERDNLYYSKQYARVAAKVASRIENSSAVQEKLDTEAIEAVTVASVNHFNATFSGGLDQLAKSNVKQEVALEPKLELEPESDAEAEPDSEGDDTAASPSSMSETAHLSEKDVLNEYFARGKSATSCLLPQSTFLDQKMQQPEDDPLSTAHKMTSPSGRRTWSITTESSDTDTRYKAYVKQPQLQSRKRVVDSGQEKSSSTVLKLTDEENDCDANRLAQALLQQIRLKEAEDRTPEKPNIANDAASSRGRDARNVGTLQSKDDDDEYVVTWRQLQEEASRQR